MKLTRAKTWGLCLREWILIVSVIAAGVAGPALALSAPASGLIVQKQEADPAEVLVLERESPLPENERGEEETAEAEEVASGPLNAREKAGVYVFLVWLWLIIGVLVYVLRLKIREADRLLETKFLK